MSVIAAETGDDNFRCIRLAIAVGVLHEQDIGRVRNPDSAMSDSDAARDIQALHEHGELVRLTVGVGIFKDFDAVFARPRRSSRIFERLGDPKAASFINCHRHRIDDVRFRSHQFH